MAPLSLQATSPFQRTDGLGHPLPNLAALQVSAGCQFGSPIMGIIFGSRATGAMQALREHHDSVLKVHESLLQMARKRI
jgi:hypothetical protein